MAPPPRGKLPTTARSNEKTKCALIGAASRANPPLASLRRTTTASRTHFAQLPVHLAPRNRRPCALALALVFAGCSSPCLGTHLTLPHSLCRATTRCAPAGLRLPRADSLHAARPCFVSPPGLPPAAALHVPGASLRPPSSVPATRFLADEKAGQFLMAATWFPLAAVHVAQRRILL